MKRSVVPLVALCLTLVVPFAARPKRIDVEAASETLVILTPHNEAARYELERAFRTHMRSQGRRVHIDWRTPGGTSEITRYVASEYSAAFQAHWTRVLGQPWSERIASAFANPRVAPDGRSRDPAVRARRAFLDSNVGCGIDLMFGGGSVEFENHAAAGRLVDAELRKQTPPVFDPESIPETFGGERYRDPLGRWIGVCLTGFGICFNRDVLERRGISTPPQSWQELASPRYFGQLAIADPTKSGAAVKAFEMVIQQQMAEALAEAERRGVADATELDHHATSEGWDKAMRLIRRIAANARYFSDSSSKIVLDVAMGDAAAGMCIDFYGRFQSEVVEASGRRGRVGFVLPHAGTSIDADPIGLLRGAPHRSLALEFMGFVLSEAGQKVWSFRRGAPGGPERYSLRRLPILKSMYRSEYAPYRSDPGERPYETSDFVYNERWTGKLFPAIAFVIRVMCIDSGVELQDAFQALDEARFPPQATALFDDVTLVNYAAVSGNIGAALKSPRVLEEVHLASRLIENHRSQYRRVTELARAGK